MKTIEPTVDYAPETRSASSPTRQRIGHFASSSSQSGEDLLRLLRRRLLILGLMVAISGSINTIRNVVVPTPLWQAGLSETFRTHPWLAPDLTVDTVAWAAVFILSRRKELSLQQLRAVELVVVAIICIANLWDTWSYNHKPEVEILTHPRLGNALSITNAYAYVILIIGYGVFVPNSWRRCLLVLTAITLAFVVVAMASVPLQSAREGFLTDYITVLTTNLGVAIALAVFGAHGLSILRRQIYEARRLGQYVLRQRLGGGGMGEVFRAEHALLRRPAAIKLIRPDRAGDPKNLARFEREVQATATLTHPNTIQIYDYGHAEDGTFYYVMEYLDGLTLEELVKAHGPLPPARAIFLLCQVCMALREAHSIGLIHRDIKPSNIIVCERGGLGDVAKLLDFGLVRSSTSHADDANLTQHGTITGTPAYMSPEQAATKDQLDATSDIYSVGALAYFLLTGRAPFQGRSGVQVLAAHLYEPPAPLTQHRPDLPSDLEAVVLRCLAKESRQRYVDAESLAAALSGCQNSGAWTAQDAANWWRRRDYETNRVRSQSDGFEDGRPRNFLKGEKGDGHEWH